MAQAIKTGPAAEDARVAKLQELQAAALDPLIDLILEHFVQSLPEDAAAIVLPWLETAEGRAAFRAKWPIIVDGYFDALRSVQGD